MIFMVAIAIFYQKKFHVQTFYYLYIIPIILLIVSAFVLNDFIKLLASLTSFFASYFLYRRMVGV